MQKNITIKANDIVDVIFAFLLIYFTRSMWPAIPTLSSLDILMKAMFVGVIVFRVILSRLKKKRMHYIVLLCIVLFYLLAYIVFIPIKSEEFIKMVFFAIGTMIYQACETTGHNALKYYVRMVFFIAVVSLFFWVFASLLGIIHPSGMVYSVWSSGSKEVMVANYFYVYFEPQKVRFLSSLIIRNSSMFVEAPMFSFHLCVALLYELFVNKSIGYKRIIILLICIASTFSTTGCIIATIAVSLRILLNAESKSILKKIKIVLIPSVIVVFVIVFDTIIVPKVSSYSGSVRVDDFIAGYKAWMVSPILGNGYNTLTVIQQYMSSFRLNNLGFSNSIMMILAYGGIYLFFPYFIAMIFAVKMSVRDKERFIFVILFLLMFVVTVVPFQILVMYILSWIITGNIESKESYLRRKRSCRFEAF